MQKIKYMKVNSKYELATSRNKIILTETSMEELNNFEYVKHINFKKDYSLYAVYVTDSDSTIEYTNFNKVIFDVEFVKEEDFIKALAFVKYMLNQNFNYLNGKKLKFNQETDSKN